MKLSRTFRQTAALLALCGMLFMQLAVAAYACPLWSAQPDSQKLAQKTADAAMRDMPGCEGVDQEQPALCQAQAQGEPQSLDKPSPPQVPLFIPLALMPAWQPSRDTAQTPALPPSPPLTRATAPPLSIRNCCFRF